MKKLMMIAATALTVAAFAQEPAGPAASGAGRPAMPSRFERGMGGPMGADPLLRAVMNQKVADALGLTDEQKAKIKELRDGGASREQQAKFRKGLELQAKLMRAETIDEAAVMAAVDEAWEARKEMAKEQVRRIIAVRKILTPEQAKMALSKMRELRGARPTRRGKGRQADEKTPPAPPPEKPATGDEPPPKPAE